MTRTIRDAAAVLSVAMLAACADPVATGIPDLGDGTLHLFGVLVADSNRQVVHVSQTDSRPIVRLEGVLSEVAADGSAIPVATAVPLTGQGVAFPLVFEAAVHPGRRYRVTVTAPERPTATAETTVPADFAIGDVEARGDPPGSDGLEASWTPSGGAFRYIVNVRAEPDCVGAPPFCETFGEPWATVTSGPRIDAVVPESAIPPGRTRGVEVAVYAVNRELFDYLTTGVGGPFTVVPRQNVQGGHGVLGAWVRRSTRIP